MGSAPLDAPDRPARLPRWLTALLVGVIVVAAGAALVWPSLGRPAAPPAPAGSDGVAVIRRALEVPGSAGRVGSAAPDFEWTADPGGVRRLSDLRGHTVIVTFWATWCLPCREEMPAFDRAAAQDPDLRVIAVDLQEDGAKVRGFFDHLSLRTLEPVIDPNGAVTRSYGVLSLPTSFFVGTDGVIRDMRLGGPMTPEAIAAAIANARR